MSAAGGRPDPMFQGAQGLACLHAAARWALDPPTATDLTGVCCLTHLAATVGMLGQICQQLALTLTRVGVADHPADAISAAQERCAQLVVTAVATDLGWPEAPDA